MCQCSCTHPDCPNGLYEPEPVFISQSLNNVPVHVTGHGARNVAPESWTLPMNFRSYKPWGYVYGEPTDKNQLHSGLDFNDGPTALADMGQPLYAVRPGVITYAKRVAGWGTLLKEGPYAYQY